MTRTFARLLAVSAVMAVACAWPTDACGCTPPPPVAAIVTGRVTTAADAPVARARVAIDVVPATFSSEPAFDFGSAITTRSDGSFVARPRTFYGTRDLALRAAVVRAGTTDTVRLRLAATVRFDGTPDTVAVTVKLP